jgi:hypothetical protein
MDTSVLLLDLLFKVFDVLYIRSYLLSDICYHF